MKLRDTSILKNQFKEVFAQEARLEVFAPGRANVIGEHTDYNGGFVLPFAIDKGITFLASMSLTDKCTIISNDFNQKLSFGEIPGENIYPWMNYLRNAMILLLQEGYSFQAFNMIFGGDLPIGAGLSSSSALTCGFLKTMDALFDLKISDQQIVNFASIAENGTGLRGGMMDQNAIVYGKETNCLLIDCKQHSKMQVTLPANEEHQWVLFNSGVKHTLVQTEYNTRREECDEALEEIQKIKNTEMEFRDLQWADLRFLKSDVLRNRLKHYISENDRVQKMVPALKRNEVSLIHNLLNESHQSLATSYQVSCPEIDFIQAEINELNIGSRIMGGGFGGCLISYFPKNKIEEFSDKLNHRYSSTFELELNILAIEASKGLHLKM